MKTLAALLVLCAVAAVFGAEVSLTAQSAASNCADPLIDAPYVNINCKELKEHKHSDSPTQQACYLGGEDSYTLSIKFKTPCSYQETNDITLNFYVDIWRLNDGIEDSFYSDDFTSQTIAATDANMLGADASCPETPTCDDNTKFQPGCEYQMDRTMPVDADMLSIISHEFIIQVGITVPDAGNPDNDLYCVWVNLAVPKPIK